MRILGKFGSSNLHHILYCTDGINVRYDIERRNITNLKDIDVHTPGHFRKDNHKVNEHKPRVVVKLMKPGVEIGIHTDPQGTGHV
jgi:hypothetical protein